MAGIKHLLAGAGLLLVIGSASTTAAADPAGQAGDITVITPGQVRYQPLNPARGDASPRAGVLWGDIRRDVPSGVLLQFADGFASPPHIHNITYRAVVISGAVHNDDPDAAHLWLGPGSFWTQPAGEVHVTAARPGAGATAFLEILQGPYLVQPGARAFDNGEQPLNLAASNVVWMDAAALDWIEIDAGVEHGPQAALLWGEPGTGGLSGSFIRLPAGHTAELSTVNGDLKAVLISGEVSHHVAGATAPVALAAGGYFASAPAVGHTLVCAEREACIVYLRTDGRFQVR
ncbi:MAG: hypothetical protein CME59_05715 [Halioglobus sp.]|nr:hypothetical protein [Halioglobus sp.]